jgi:hypothetical protein
MFDLLAVMDRDAVRATNALSTAWTRISIGEARRLAATL